MNEARLEIEQVTTKDGNKGVVLTVIRGDVVEHVVMGSKQAHEVAEMLAKKADLGLIKTESSWSAMDMQKAEGRVAKVVSNLYKRKQTPERIAKEIIPIVMRLFY